MREDLAEIVDDDRIVSAIWRAGGAGPQLHELVEHALESVLHGWSSFK